ncbi:hypothetical protein EOM39_07565, partial [Candidatus Gracilibacteria bacterium]|nr:hypothetical protein [Candidatus Gracilibacteria bacterium]
NTKSGESDYVVFEPNQIKLTTNENPTTDDDIRYAIEDFGEKIGGARKDVWMKRGLQVDDLEYLNDAELEKYVKKDYVWRSINYQKMLSEGTPRGTLYLLKATRDSIPATLYVRRNAEKAEIDERRKIYVDTITKIKEGIEKVKTADDLARLVDDIFIKTGYIEKRGERYTTTQLFNTNPALDVALFNNWQKIIKMYDRLDSWAEREKIGLDKTEKALENYSIKQQDDGKYYIYRKTWMGYSQISDTGFDNEEVANTILRMAVEKEQAGKQANRKQRIVPPQLERINRKGIDYRSNKNVTGDDYLKVFKFRGGEFGNWLSEIDRQTSLNYGYDALMDLADALNIEKENISLNGDLAIAFGARGQGLSGASAHYEPERRVINLTKMNGAGSLAHEWFHAVDKYIAGKDTTSLFSQLYSYQRKSVPEKTSKAFDNVIDTMKYVTRKQTDAEIDMRAQRVYDSAKKVVDRAFKDYFTNHFEEDMTPERLAIYGKKRRNATAQEKTQYQELKNRVYDGDATAWAELDKLRKTVTNRQIPRGEGASSYTYDQV